MAMAMEKKKTKGVRCGRRRKRTLRSECRLKDGNFGYVSEMI